MYLRASVRVSESNPHYCDPVYIAEIVWRFQVRGQGLRSSLIKELSLLGSTVSVVSVCRLYGFETQHGGWAIILCASELCELSIQSYRRSSTRKK